MKQIQTDVVVIGAGLTGLTTAFHLARRGMSVLVLDRKSYVGGQIRTYREHGFIFESGPNTGVVSNPEVAELFEALKDDCRLEVARKAAKRRLIWKGDRFHALPSGPWSAVTTPLFSWRDKLGILGEPFRPKGTDPDESVAALARRRLGKSFADYAVDPFIAGVYGGNPEALVTRHALPKLYNLEQTYGSFIKGAMAKSREPRTERDKLVTKEVFSVGGGLDNLTRVLAKRVGLSRVYLNVSRVEVQPSSEGPRWRTTFVARFEKLEVASHYVVSTASAHNLPEFLPFIDGEELSPITSLAYAPIIQVAVGVFPVYNWKLPAFGGLVPSCEKRDLLGILFPSACFGGRAPEQGALFSFFLGGMRQPELMKSDNQRIYQIVGRSWRKMLKLPQVTDTVFMRIFRHERAIPQYGADTEDRLRAVDRLQRQYPGLILAGNLRDGIGMADRIRQGANVAEALALSKNK